MNNLELARDTFANAQSLAEAWRIAGRWADALALLQGLQPVADELGHAAQATRTLLVGRILIDQAMFGGVETIQEREAVLEAALTHAQQTQDPALLGAAWDAKGFSLHAAYFSGDRRNEPEHELEFFEQGLALRRQAQQPAALAESLFHVGLVHGVLRRDHKQALPYFKESYQLASAANDLIMASYAIRHIGFVRAEGGDLEDACKDFEESLRLREAAGWTPGVAMALLALASAEVERGQLARARPLLERARSIFQALGAARHLQRVDHELAQLPASESHSQKGK